jgi:hypothetical protein
MFDHVRKVNIEEVRQKVKEPVFVGSKKYYSNFTRISSKKNMIIQFGRNVNIKIIGNELELSIDFRGSLTERLNDSNFVLDFYRFGSIKANESNLTILDNHIRDEYIELILKYNRFLLNTVALLKIFNINTDEIDLDSMSAIDMKELNGLIDTFVLNKEFPNQEIDQGLIKIKVSNITLLLAALKKNDKVIVQDINDFKKGDVFLNLDYKYIGRFLASLYFFYDPHHTKNMPQGIVDQRSSNGPSHHD